MAVVEKRTVASLAVTLAVVDLVEPKVVDFGVEVGSDFALGPKN